MKKVILSCLLTAGFAWLSLIGCKKETIDPGTYVPVSFSVPIGWPQPVYTFNNNPLTSDGFVLGRKLFYDMRLSRDNTVSCGTCHQQFASFANLDHPLSHGINNLLGNRNSPGPGKRSVEFFFWDGGVINLENQPINPIQNHVEMDMTLPEVVTRLVADPDYVAKFRKVFGDEIVNSQRIFRALAQFMGAMVSSDSRYDKVARGDDGASFTEAEQRGLNLFRQKCEACHKEPLFSDFSIRNNGLPPDPFLRDSGREHITLDPNDRYKFKVPSLRNVDMSRPYMHDGRFPSLEAVLNHYHTGIHPSSTLDPLLNTGISMNENEQKDIISFLKTLSDSTFVKDKRFAEPAN